MRTRVCIDGDHGQDGCLGDAAQEQQCNIQECPYLSNWGEWGACSQTCNEGVQERNRECRNGNVGDLGCEGETTETKVCYLKACVFWTPWTEFGACSRSCGAGGLKQRTRTCIGGAPGDEGCEGVPAEQLSCNTHDCPKCMPDYELIGMEHGTVQCTDVNYWKSVCLFTCNDGYFISGESTLTCMNPENSTFDWDYQPPVCLEKCNTEKMDIGIVLDSSSSIGAESFEIAKTFLARLVSLFTIGPDATQFTAIRYNSHVEDLWELEDHNDVESLKYAISQIKYDGSGTRTGRALRHMKRKFYQEGKFLGRPDAVKTILLITDGNSNDDAGAVAEILRSKNLYINVIGVGDVDRVHIGDMASKPEEKHTMFVDSYSTLAARTGMITSQLRQCSTVKCIPSTSVLDLLVMVDTSSSIGRENFDLVQDFLANLFGNFPVAIDDTRIGLIAYNNKVKIEFFLNTFSTKRDMVKAIKNITYEGVGTLTGQAMVNVASRMFDVDRGFRDNIPTVTVLITDGKSQDPVALPASFLQQLSRVIAVGIGEGADEQELQEVASGPGDENVFRVESFASLASIHEILANSIAESCSDL